MAVLPSLIKSCLVFWQDAVEPKNHGETKLPPKSTKKMYSLSGLAMGILVRLRLAKIRTTAQPNSPDMQPKRTKKVRLNIRTVDMASDWLIANLGTVTHDIRTVNTASDWHIANLATPRPGKVNT